MDTPTQRPQTPRAHAALILAEPSRERRQALLEACPEPWRDLVRTHVENAFALTKARPKGAGDLAKQVLSRQRPR